jgi:hypothetical protein
MSYVGKDDFVFVKHTGEIARVTEVLTYEWNLEYLDGTTGRLERDDFIPVSPTVLWVLTADAPKSFVRAIVLAAQDLNDD